MPRIKKTIDHQLSQEEALARARHFVRKAKGATNLQADWDHNCCRFTANVQGLRIQGKVYIEPTVIAVEAQLPLIAVPFTGWLHRIVDMAMQHPVSDNITPQPTHRLPAGIDPDPNTPTVLFLHIPKAAGTSLAEYLHAQCRIPAPPIPGEELFKEGIYYGTFGFFKDPNDLVPAFVQPYLARPDLRAVLAHASYGIHRYLQRPYVYISLLRHPVDRAISMYYFLKAQDNIPIDTFFQRTDLRELDNDQTRRISGCEPAFGQCDRTMLDKAKGHLEQDFAAVGVAERFPEFIVLLQQQFNWPAATPFYKRNVTPNRPKAAEISPHVLERIRDLNRYDLELYQFAQQLMQQQIDHYGQTLIL